MEDLVFSIEKKDMEALHLNPLQIAQMTGLNIFHASSGMVILWRY